MLGGTSDAWHNHVALSVDVRLPAKNTPSSSSSSSSSSDGGGGGAVDGGRTRAEPTTSHGSYGGGCLHVVNGGGPLSLAPSFRGHCVQLHRDEANGALSWSLVSGTSDTLASGPVSGASERTKRKEVGEVEVEEEVEVVEEEKKKKMKKMKKKNEKKMKKNKKKATTTKKVEESRWYRLGLSYVQPTMSVWVNGVVVKEIKVLKNVTKGRVALCSGWNAADFDNFKITSSGSSSLIRSSAVCIRRKHTCNP